MKKNQGVFGLISAASAGASAFSSLRTVKKTGDKLTLANAIASLLVAVTGALLAVRSMREKGLEK
ncbi:hypothetical protein [Labedaea rhizosphaerae]|jgi:hypothetical protein|uniref:Uncharacterized protein n=1 Tax=Labedaea rhizosphaerae TaxID=598644 RepID=A0A4R6SDR6_LABRH|nr:hypothetical protein [Labedaea rhizosphaerae]TDP98081.1 hypothetical protein EV186_1031061 [Labedaea rhizosphaerae]